MIATSGSSSSPAASAVEGLALGSPSGRWVLAATVLGSGAVFVEMTVVNVALPALGRDLELGMEGLQWVVDGYLLSLSALILLGGSLGDVFRRRLVFVAGLIGFAATSVLCALAPNPILLVGLRVLQGAAGALLVPNSLAIVDTAFREADRSAAVGVWAAWSATTTALGPLLGGWLVDSFSWRWVFAIAALFALGAAWVAARHVPDAGGRRDGVRSLDVLGAVLATAGLAGVVAALVSGPGAGFGNPLVLAAGIGGCGLLAAFIWAERRATDPMLPLSVFRSRQFTGANLTTLLVYGALAGLFFFLVLQLQSVLGYSALAAGAALLPVNVLMLVISPAAGRLAQRIGPRWPMTVGALMAAAGMLLLGRLAPGGGYVDGVLPGAAVFGLGLAVLVAPLTAAVLASVPDEQVGVASAINNAAARLAGLLALAVVPLAAGVGGLAEIGGASFATGYTRAMWICAGLCAAGGVVAFLTIRRGAAVAPVAHPSPSHGCTHRRPLASTAARET